MRVLLTPPGPTVEQQTEMARHAGRTLASLHPEQVSLFLPQCGLAVYISSDGVQFVFMLDCSRVIYNTVEWPLLQFI